MRLMTKWSFLGLVAASLVTAIILSMIRVSGIPSPNYPNLIYIASQAFGLIGFSAIPALIIGGIYKLITKKPIQKVFTNSIWIRHWVRTHPDPLKLTMEKIPCE